MPCFHPIKAYKTADGISFVDKGQTRSELALPCGQCVGCRLERSRQWAVRGMHEAQMHKKNCFVTLTYDDDHVPFDLSLNYLHYQQFMRKLRKVVGPVRFFMCGEYGEENLRPHFHACLFGIDFPDKFHWRVSDAGSDSYRSPILEQIWTKGSSEIGEVNFKSVAYVARYIMKKVTGDLAEEHYKSVNVYTGEMYDRVPEFCQMSRRPGIGASWFAKYGSEVFPRDRVVVNGHECAPPRYYYRLLKEEANLVSDVVDSARALKIAKMNPDESSEARLAVRETVAKARLSFKRRS